MTALPRVSSRDLQIDWRPFLNRAPIPSPDLKSLDVLSRASILITGAGGSIGGALALRLAAIRPKTLILLEASEQALHRLLVDLQKVSPLSQIVSYLGSTNDKCLLDDIFAAYAPEYVFHAAAHKHLPLLEHHPLAAIQNNVLGTSGLSECTSRHRSRLILLSTDKAADPTSILGATKRVAEQIVTSQGGIALRLVNVLGSEGSVVETFLDQSEQGQPLTITHPGAERYFMTSQEAIDLLLSVAVNSASGSLLTPPLVRTHNIVALASFIANLSGAPAPTNLGYSGLKDGEKLIEALHATHEELGAIDAAGCMIVVQNEFTASDKFDELVGHLNLAVNQRDGTDALQAIGSLVPDYSPSLTVLEAANRFVKAVQP